MTYLTYRFRARRTTSVTVSPFSAALACAARQSSSGTRTPRTGVLGLFGMSAPRLRDNPGEGFEGCAGKETGPGDFVGAVLADDLDGLDDLPGGGAAHGVPCCSVYVHRSSPVYERQGARRKPGQGVVA